MPRRRSHRQDGNQHRLVSLWITLGGSDEKFDGVFDRIWGKCGMTCCIEIKNGDKPPSQRKLTKREKAFAERWRGMYKIIENEDDVLALDKKMRQMSEIFHDFYYQETRDMLGL